MKPVLISIFSFTLMLCSCNNDVDCECTTIYCVDGVSCRETDVEIIENVTRNACVTKSDIDFIPGGSIELKCKAL